MSLIYLHCFFSLTWWILPSADYGVLTWTLLLSALWGVVTSSRWDGDKQFSMETPSKDECRFPALEAVQTGEKSIVLGKQELQFVPGTDPGVK